jgi:hypothetical protein
MKNLKDQILAALNAEYAKLVAYDGTDEFKFKMCIAPAVKACGFLLKETYEGKMVFTQENFEKFCDDKEEGLKPNILNYGQRLIDIF